MTSNSTQVSKHKHHKIPSSRGGSDEEWNLEELSPYEHALTHALDFVLFENAPMFDCRQPGWMLIPEDLRVAVRKEIGNRRRVQNYQRDYTSHIERLAKLRRKNGLSEDHRKSLSEESLRSGRNKGTKNAMYGKSAQLGRKW